MFWRQRSMGNFEYYTFDTLPFFFPFRHLKLYEIQSISSWSSSISQESAASRCPSSRLVSPFHSWSDSKSESRLSSCSLLAMSFMSRGNGSSSSPSWSWSWQMSTFSPADSVITCGGTAGWFFSPDIFLFFFGGRPFGGISWLFFWGNGS